MAEPAELAREWVEFAHADCEMAQRAIATSPKFYWQAMFHSQQAVEKILKAFLMYHGEVFEKTHDLGNLCSLCRSIESQFPLEWTDLDCLTDYAVHFRYPGVDPATEEDAQRGIKLARTVIDKVLELLPPACRPANLSNGG